jgi:hypothetical protein
MRRNRPGAYGIAVADGRKSLQEPLQGLVCPLVQPGRHGSLRDGRYAACFTEKGGFCARKDRRRSFGSQRRSGRACNGSNRG